MTEKHYSYLFPDLCLLFAATLWGIFWYPLRLFESAGMPAIWVTLVAFSTAFVVGLIATYKQRRQYLVHPLKLVLIALTTGWSNAAFLVAVVDGNAIRVILLFYLSPIWTVIMGYFILKEKISLQAMMVFALAFLGAVVMLWNPDAGFPWPQGSPDWLALSAGFTFAWSNVLIRSIQDINISIKTTASWSGGIIIAGLWILLTGGQLPEIPALTWYYSMMLGFFGIVFMTMAVQYGVTHMPVYRSAIILIFEILVTTVTVYWWAGENMTMIEWIGGGMVAISAWLIARTGVDSEG